MRTSRVELRHFAVAVATLAILAGCASGMHTTMLPAIAPSGGGANTTAAGSAAIAMTLTIPKPARRNVMRPDYISASTKSIGFKYTILATKTAQPEQYANVTPSSPACKSSSSGTTCTLSFKAVPGKIAYTVDAFDGLHGRGHKLGSAQARLKVIPNTANHFSITLDGVPVSFSMSADESSVTQSVPEEVGLTISAYDAQHNLIVNSPAFWNTATNSAFKTVTVSITNSGEGSSEFTVERNGKTLPTVSGHPSEYKVSLPFTNLYAYYTGIGASAASLTLRTPATGISDQVKITVSPHTAVTPKYLYVAGNGSKGGVYVFTLPFHGGETPLAILNNLPAPVVGLATDGFGTVAVVTTQTISVYHGTPSATNPAFASYSYPSGFFANGEAGNVAAFDPNGNLYVTAGGSTYAVLRYDLPFTASTTPTALKVCYECDGIGFDSSGTMYVGEGGAAHPECGFSSADNTVEIVNPPYTNGSQTSKLLSCSSTGSSQVSDVHGVSASDAGVPGDAGLWAGLGQSGLYDPNWDVDYNELRDSCRDGFGNPPYINNFAVYANTTYYSNPIGPSHGTVCSVSPATAPTPAPNQPDNNVYYGAAMPSGVYGYALMVGP